MGLRGRECRCCSGEAAPWLGDAEVWDLSSWAWTSTMKSAVVLRGMGFTCLVSLVSTGYGVHVSRKPRFRGEEVGRMSRISKLGFTRVLVRTVMVRPPRSTPSKHAGKHAYPPA